MKKYLSIILLTILCTCLFGVDSNAYAAQPSYATSARSAVVMEAGSKRVLYNKDGDVRCEMASTTKIMTALIAIENADVNKTVCVDRSAVGIEGSSIYLRANEHLTLKELLYGLMLQSGNDCAVAIAKYVGGSVENFANMMNDRVKSLGLTNTHFCNPHGLHNKDHYTSAYDLGYIACVAMENPIFAEIVSTKQITVPNEGMSYDRILHNKNKLLNTLPDANGVKTGYTKNAGRCFVGSAKRNGMQLVCVVLNCGPMFEDCQRLLEQCFNDFHYEIVIPEGKLVGSYAKNNQIKFFFCEKSFCVPLRDGEKTTTQFEYDQKNECGEIRVYLGKQLIFSWKLSTISTTK